MMEPNEPVGVVIPLETRMTLFMDSVSREHLTSHSTGPINIHTLREHCASLDHLRSANMSVSTLRAMGAAVVDDLVLLGFDAIDLRNGRFLTQVVAEYGRDEARRAFLTSARDAVAIAPSNVPDVLNMTANDVLALCTNNPISASDVLRSMIGYRAGSNATYHLGIEPVLRGIIASTLIETGLRAAHLRPLGIDACVLITCMDASTADLRALNLSFSV